MILGYHVRTVQSYMDIWLKLHLYFRHDSLRIAYIDVVESRKGTTPSYYSKLCKVEKTDKSDKSDPSLRDQGIRDQVRVNLKPFTWWRFIRFLNSALGLAGSFSKLEVGIECHKVLVLMMGRGVEDFFFPIHIFVIETWVREIMKEAFLVLKPILGTSF